MTKETFNQLINVEKVLDSAEIKGLAKVLKEFPYFQAARAVHLKGLHQNHSFLYNGALKKTAAYTTDRSVLFEYITSDAFKQHGVAEQIRKRREEEKVEKSRDFDLAVQMKSEEADRVLDPGLFEKNPD